MSSYVYCHSPNQYNGDISGIEIRWQNSAIQKLAVDAELANVPVETLKALSEHYSFLLGYRLGNTQVTIRGGPHEFSVDSRTGSTAQDPDHITVETSGGPGKRRCHIYLAGHGEGTTKYDNVWVRGESVMVKSGKSYSVDTGLCTGDWNLAGTGTGYGQGGSTYGTAAAAQGGGGTSASAAGQSEWIWSPQYGNYYSSVTGEWAPQ